MKYFENIAFPKGWQVKCFSEFLKPVQRSFKLENDKEYQLCGVRWYGNGVFIREVKYGQEVKQKSKSIIKSGDVIYNKLFAWRGSFAIVWDDTDGCCVSNEFPTYQLDEAVVLRLYLHYYFQTEYIRKNADSLSQGASANSRFRLHQRNFANLELPTPTIDEQHRIVAKLQATEQRLRQIQTLQAETEENIYKMLLGAYGKITQDVPHIPMAAVAPLIRRAVEIEPDEEYPELGLRSFGKGTFHKPAIKGSEIGGKRIYRIEAGDLMFSNVFAWEGAIAVAQPEDHGRFGSHRFMSRVPQPGVATAEFLCFHFQTEEGLQTIQYASPGSAGRNRTLGLKALDAIEVPVPNYEAQLWFNQIYNKAQALRKWQAEVQEEAEALLPSVLDKAFRGEL